MKTKTVVVFSGGQDSTTCLIQALQQYDEVHCITFDYGQRHREEIEVAKKLAASLKVVAHKIMDVTLLNELAVSSLTRDEISVPSYAELKQGERPNTFVPGRNILFFTLAAIYAYQIEANTVIAGTCETDFSNYPDCRDQFVKAFNHAAILGIDRQIDLVTPLMWLTKAETWALADSYQQLDFIRQQTLTCYNGIQGDGCGDCPACRLRSRGLDEYLNNRDSVMQSLHKKAQIV